MLTKQIIPRVVYPLYRTLIVKVFIRAIFTRIAIAIHSSNHDAEQLCDHAATMATTTTANHGPAERPNDDHQREHAKTQV